MANYINNTKQFNGMESEEQVLNAVLNEMRSRGYNAFETEREARASLEEYGEETHETCDTQRFYVLLKEVGNWTPTVTVTIREYSVDCNTDEYAYSVHTYED